MRSKCLIGLGCAAISLGTGSVVQAALQVALHEVNTSVGLLPTTATNKWKLQTDPSITDVAPAGETPSFTTVGDPIYAQYIPSDGKLNNAFDPTKFTLATNPNTGKIDLGWSVQGLGAYQVIGFDVIFAPVDVPGGGLDKGGYLDVQEDPTTHTVTDYTTVGDVSGSETGEIDNIHFQLVPSLQNTALPANQDQFFCQVNLDPILGDGPASAEDFNPGVAYVFANDDPDWFPPSDNGYLTIEPLDLGNPNTPVTITTPFNEIDSNSSVPEPASVSLIVLGAGVVALRRPKASIAR